MLPFVWMLYLWSAEVCFSICMFVCLDETSQQMKAHGSWVKFVQLHCGTLSLSVCVCSLPRMVFSCSLGQCEPQAQPPFHLKKKEKTQKVNEIQNTSEIDGLNAHTRSLNVFCLLHKKKKLYCIK